MQKTVNTKILIRSAVPIAIAGAISLTSCYANPTPAPKPVEIEPTPIVQTEPVITKYTLKGVTFHDYNGDGIYQENEPVVPGIELKITPSSNTEKEISLKTDAKGEYNIKLDPGKYRLNVIPGKVLGYNDQPFSYIGISKAEYKTIYEDLDLEINSDLKYDVALMQGFLTLPFSRETKFLLTDYPFGIADFVDMDDEIGIKTWNDSRRTYNNHSGIDYYIEENTSILAAASGTVIKDAGPSNINQGQPVFILHDRAPYFLPTVTAYIHLNKALVKPGDKVNRGDVIGFSGKNMGGGIYDGKHLHFGILLISEKSPWGYYYKDAYRNCTAPLEIKPLLRE